MSRSTDALSDATPLRLGLVRWFLGVAVLGASAAAVANYRIQANEKELEAAKVEQAALKDANHAQDIHLQRLDDVSQSTAKLLEKIDSRMERWERRGDRPARSGQ